MENITRFILAGNARFTVRNSNTGNRFTFEVRAPKKETERGGLVTDHTANVRFVKVLTGSNNESDYTFIGTIFIDNNKFVHSRKSRISAEAQSVQVFDWFFAKKDELPENIEVNHEGMCGRCGRTLTVPESVESGYGPECADKIGL
jgi:hypothetical protein